MELPGQIFVKNMNGKTITLDDVESTDTIFDIKKEFLKKIKKELKKEKINDDPDNFLVMFPPGRVKGDDKTMDEIGVKKESTLYVVYKLGPPKEKKFPEKGVTGELSNDTINDLIMRVINTDDDPRSVVVIPGSVIGSDRSLLESMVTPNSKYFDKHDLFKQQLPLPILQEAYESNKNVHIFLVDPGFNIRNNSINDVRNIFDSVKDNDSMIFSDESSDEIDDKMGFYIEEMYGVFKEINLKNIEDFKEKELYVYLYILPFTMRQNELQSLSKLLNDTEHYIYLKPDPHQDLTSKNFKTNSTITKRLKQWHSNNISSNSVYSKGILTDAGKEWVKAAEEDMEIRTGGGKVPKHYTAGLSRKDKKKQQKNLKKSTKDYRKGKYTSRPKLKSFQSKKSNWTSKFEKKYGKDVKKYKQISKVTGIPVPALKAVVKKGMGAYFSSGSRPNQTPESWGKARMYSYIMGGPTRKVDQHITEKYNVQFP